MAMVSMLRTLWSMTPAFHASPKHCSVTISSKRRRNGEALFSASSAPALPNILRRRVRPASSSFLSMSFLRFRSGRCAQRHKGARTVTGGAFGVAREREALARQPEQRQVERDVLAKVGGDAHILGQQAQREARGKPAGDDMLLRHQLSDEA